MDILEPDRVGVGEVACGAQSIGPGWLRRDTGATVPGVTWRCQHDVFSNSLNSSILRETSFLNSTLVALSFLIHGIQFVLVRVLHYFARQYRHLLLAAFADLKNMDFGLEDSQNAAPGLPTMAEQQKLSSTTRRADTQSVTKR